MISTWSIPPRGALRSALAAAAIAAAPAFAIAEGTQSAPDHWAFQALGAPTPPAAEKSHPIDAFIQSGLHSSGMSLAPPADPRTAIRRLYFDLHGLPPTPAQVEAFLATTDPQAYPKLVDELLASPRYGERWAQHWLDLVRYADTHGFEVNTERPNAWPYRDYVIRALNEDRPYDQFIREQLAGDALGEDAATGFLVASAVLLPGQIGKDDVSKRLARQDSLDEIIVATGDTFLGMSIGCARCHKHKFDPISQRDYYAMQAFFAGVEYGDRPLREPGSDAKLEKHTVAMAALRERLAGFVPPATSARTILIDDEDPNRTAHLVVKNGHGGNPAGTGRGYRDDPGGADRDPNLSGGRYTWWDNKPGQDVFTYHPEVEGRFRLWISWGVHGSGVHTRDARYLLDRDGDLKTQADQIALATADQYYFAGVADGETEKKPLWSGLLDTGVHEFGESSRIVLRAGETGTGITADVIVLQEEIERHKSRSVLRAPVNPARNIEQFVPVEAKSVRFTSFATINNNQHEPCLDELEIFSAQTAQNLALDGRPSSSGNYSNDGQHQLKHINDGQYGNSQSWISNQAGQGWVQIELPEPAVINRIEWGRDRTGKFPDRLAYRYRIEVATHPDQWTVVAQSDDRLPYGTPYDATAALLRSVPANAADAVRADVREFAAHEKAISKLKKRQSVYAGKFRTPDPTHVLHRGDPEQKLERVAPAVPRALGSLAVESSAPEQARRLALANWIASPENPLTARVMANRIWQWHFGRGLVDTASDFGLNGAQPTHPRLLDWLAAELIRSGWSLKHLHRLIVSSATYRQSNRIDPAAQKVDADCRLLWRFPSRRLEAEAIRDGILAVSGQLNLKAGGPGFNFFKSRGGLSGFPDVNSFTDEGLRRMIYAHKVRMERVPVFGAFDCPDAGQATPRRSRATTAIQALNLFNSQFVFEQAQAFAARVRSECGDAAGSDAQVRSAFRLAFGRTPSDLELASSVQTVNTHGLAAICRVLFNSNEFLFLP